MKYLCLVYLEEQKLHAINDRECQACGDGLRQSGVLVAAEALQPVETATTVRVRNGKIRITDGPFAETKEVIGGYALLKAANKDEVVELTRRFLNVVGQGTCEIHQLYEMPAGE